LQQRFDADRAGYSNDRRPVPHKRVTDINALRLLAAHALRVLRRAGRTLEHDGAAAIDNTIIEIRNAESLLERMGGGDLARIRTTRRAGRPKGSENYADAADLLARTSRAAREIARRGETPTLDLVAAHTGMFTTGKSLGRALADNGHKWPQIRADAIAYAKKTRSPGIDVVNGVSATRKTSKTCPMMKEAST
jgi:hypothetical protein